MRGKRVIERSWPSGARPYSVRLLIAALGLGGATMAQADSRPAHAVSPTPPGEITPIVAMSERAELLISDGVEFHFRLANGLVMICAYHGGTGGLCRRTTRADVARIDAVVEDYCLTETIEGEGPAHALTGEADNLGYLCDKHHAMLRRPYSDIFNAQGYMSEEWIVLAPASDFRNTSPDPSTDVNVLHAAQRPARPPCPDAAYRARLGVQTCE
jgi:hypothetical protein